MTRRCEIAQVWIRMPRPSSETRRIQRTNTCGQRTRSLPLFVYVLSLKISLILGRRFRPVAEVNARPRIQTIEEGQPPTVTHWSVPTTPYVLPFLPDNLVNIWARHLKKSTDWPHSVRSIRIKLKVMARTVAQGLPRNSIDEETDEHGPRFNPDTVEHDEIIVSPTIQAPPNSRRNDEGVYRQDITFILKGHIY